MFIFYLLSLTSVFLLQFFLSFCSFLLHSHHFFPLFFYCPFRFSSFPFSSLSISDLLLYSYHFFTTLPLPCLHHTTPTMPSPHYHYPYHHLISTILVLLLLLHFLHHSTPTIIITTAGLVVPVLRNTEDMSFAGVEKAIAHYGKKVSKRNAG